MDLFKSFSPFFCSFAGSWHFLPYRFHRSGLEFGDQRVIDDRNGLDCAHMLFSQLLWLILLYGARYFLLIRLAEIRADSYIIGKPLPGWVPPPTR